MTWLIIVWNSFRKINCIFSIKSHKIIWLRSINKCNLPRESLPPWKEQALLGRIIFRRLVEFYVALSFCTKSYCQNLQCCNFYHIAEKRKAKKKRKKEGRIHLPEQLLSNRETSNQLFRVPSLMHIMYSFRWI